MPFRITQENHGLASDGTPLTRPRVRVRAREIAACQSGRLSPRLALPTLLHDVVQRRLAEHFAQPQRRGVAPALEVPVQRVVRAAQKRVVEDRDLVDRALNGLDDLQQRDAVSGHAEAEAAGAAALAADNAGARKALHDLAQVLDGDAR